MRNHRPKGNPDEYLVLSLSVPTILALLGLILSFVL